MIGFKAVAFRTQIGVTPNAQHAWSGSKGRMRCFAPGHRRLTRRFLAVLLISLIFTAKFERSLKSLLPSLPLALKFDVSFVFFYKTASA